MKIAGGTRSRYKPAVAPVNYPFTVRGVAITVVFRD